MTDMHREALLIERQHFEQWYLTQGKYSFNPIGSRDCSMQWEAWQAATHPARPGVVSDEDVEEACRKYYNCGYPVYPPYFEGMRAALEHFAKGERHEH